VHDVCAEMEGKADDVFMQRNMPAVVLGFILIVEGQCQCTGSGEL
jgi:hypothetical protein